MRGEKTLKKTTDFVLAKSSADETEVLLTVSNFSLTRFANNQIHQNVSRETAGVSIRVVLGKKIGVVKTNGLSKKKLEQALEQAIGVARNQKEDPDFLSLPKPVSRYSQVKGYYQQTAQFSPQQRANKVKKIINQAKSNKFKAFGTLSNGVSELVVANSHGVFAYFPQSTASFTTTIMGDGSSGYGSSLNCQVNQLKIEKETQKALITAKKGKNPKKIRPGEHEVVLAPAAVNQMLIYLAYLGFGARAFCEGRSFLSGKLGEKIMGENITIWDDSLDEAGIPMPFDFEGAPKKKLVLVKKGVARNVAYDSYLAAKYGQENTGHALPAPNTLDAIAGHLHLRPGNTSELRQDVGGGGRLNPRAGGEAMTLPCPQSLRSSVGRRARWIPDEQELITKSIPGVESDLIKEVKKGLYISRFWYVNAHHHKTLEITGLTRDGTFMIKNGQLAEPVLNLRFTQSIPEAFNQVVGIGKKTKAMKSWIGANFVPALRIKKFNFTGISKL